MNKLNDNYQVTGTTAQRFLEEIRDISARTEYPVVNPADVCLLSFKKKTETKENNEIKKTYIFYMISRPDLANMENYGSGFRQVPCVLMTKNGKDTPRIELMEEIIRVSGLMLVYIDKNGNSVYNGVSGLALKTLCKRAGVPGDRIYDKSLWRDVYIADGLLPKRPGNDDPEAVEKYERMLGENIKFVVRHNAEYKNGKMKLQKIGMIIGVFAQTYNESGMKILADIYNEVRTEGKMGRVKVTDWEISQDRAYVHMEFPDAAEAFAEKYGLKSKLIPGITITTSDCGLSSLSVAGTYRDDGYKGMTIVNEYTRKHVGAFTFRNIMPRVNKDILDKFEAFPKAMGKLMETKISEKSLKTEAGHQDYKNRMNTAITNAFGQFDVSKSIGKKRVDTLKEVIADHVGEYEECTLYDVAEAFMNLEDLLEIYDLHGLGETAHELLTRSLARVPETDFFKSSGKRRKAAKPVTPELENLGEVV